MASFVTLQERAVAGLTAGSRTVRADGGPLLSLPAMLWDCPRDRGDEVLGPKTASCSRRSGDARPDQLRPVSHIRVRDPRCFWCYPPGFENFVSAVVVMATKFYRLRLSPRHLRAPDDRAKSQCLQPDRACRISIMARGANVACRRIRPASLRDEGRGVLPRASLTPVRPPVRCDDDDLRDDGVIVIAGREANRARHDTALITLSVAAG
jgi:hypothetical protein